MKPILWLAGLHFGLHHFSSNTLNILFLPLKADGESQNLINKMYIITSIVEFKDVHVLPAAQGRRVNLKFICPSLWTIVCVIGWDELWWASKIVQHYIR